jgi:mycothiol system anti-sigma-R factor
MDGNRDQYDVGELVGSGDCQEAVETLYRYLDGELTPERRDAIKRHLDECSPCLRAFDFEVELKTFIAKSCRDQVPDDLWRKITDALAKASDREPGDV